MTATKPMSKAAQKREERERSIARLRELLPRGSTVYCTVKHVSRSGMARDVALMASGPEGGIVNISADAADALEWPWRGSDAVRVTGCGMDMGFHAVYSLAWVLFRDDPKPTEEEAAACPRNQSVEVWKQRGGYALKHRWV